MDMNPDLATLLAFIVAFAVFVHVALDGFGLGVALLFPLFPDRHHRDVMMNSVAPVWDGNETWLVLGGGAIFAAFPLACSVLMPALYAPIIAMLLGLVFRGVAFEFRWHTERGRFLWDLAFTGGSLVAALGQWLALGTLFQGIAVEGCACSGGWWDWLTSFSVLTGLAVVTGYALLGATWLILKTTDRLRDRSGTRPRSCHLGRDRDRERVDTVSRWHLLEELVRLAANCAGCAGASRGRRCGIPVVPQPVRTARRLAVRFGPDAFRSVLRRPGRIDLSLAMPTGCFAAGSMATRGITDAPPLIRRRLWFAGLWPGGVIAVAAVAYGLRLWIM